MRLLKLLCVGALLCSSFSPTIAYMDDSMAFVHTEETAAAPQTEEIEQTTEANPEENAAEEVPAPADPVPESPPAEEPPVEETPVIEEEPVAESEPEVPPPPPIPENGPDPNSILQEIIEGPTSRNYHLTDDLRRDKRNYAERTYIEGVLRRAFESISSIDLETRVGATARRIISFPTHSFHDAGMDSWVSWIAGNANMPTPWFTHIYYGDHPRYPGIFSMETPRVASETIMADDLASRGIRAETSLTRNGHMLTFTVDFERTGTWNPNLPPVRFRYVSPRVTLGATVATYQHGSRSIRLGNETDSFAGPDGRAGETIGLLTINNVASLEVNAREITVPLGATMADIRNMDLPSFLDVRLGGQTLSPNQYQMSFVRETLDTSTVGRPQTRPRIRVSHPAAAPVELDLPIEVEWGDSVVFGGREALTERTAAAFTLHHGASPRITAAFGNRGSSEVINQNIVGEYYNFSLFSMIGHTSRNLSSSQRDQSASATGQELRSVVFERWPNRTVAYGDVVRTWVRLSEMNALRVPGNNQFIHHGGEVYYEITQSGYRPLSINRAVTTEQEIEMNTSETELRNRVAEFIDISNLPNMRVVEFTSLPDTSSTGRKEGVVRIEETLESGKTIQYDYTVPFNVVATSLTVRAETIPVPLGTTMADIRNMNLSPFLEVTLGGTTLAPDQYEWSFISEASNAITVGALNVRPRIRINHAQASAPVELDLPIDVEWGDSVVFGGNTDLNTQTVAAFTLHHGTQPKITSALGIGTTTGSIHPGHAGFPYYRFNWFDMGNSLNSILSNNAGNQSIEARGDSFRNIMVTWGTRSVNYGDVVRSWVADPTKNALRVRGNNQFINHGGEVYYEITPSGYRPLNINRAVTREHEIRMNTSGAELRNRVAEFIDISNLPNMRVVGFERLPDTSSTGRKEGVIRVEETLASGSRVMYDYTVTFNITPSLNVRAETIPILLGTTFDDIREMDLSPFLEVTFGEEVLSSDQYELQFTGTNFNATTAGVPRQRPRISVSAIGESVLPVELDLPVVVEWGDSVVFGAGGFVAARTAAAFTLHHGTRPKITLSHGNGNENDVNPIHVGFLGLPYYRFNRFDMSNINNLNLSSSTTGDNNITATGDSTRPEMLQHWRDVSVNYGDVVRSWIVLPSQNFLRRRDSNGFISLQRGGEIYYEVMPSGYRPLDINRVVTTEHEIEMNISEAELRNRVSEFINVSNFSNMSVVGFERLPDTSSTGRKDGVIRVAETLSTGKAVQYDYTVPFNVTDSLNVHAENIPVLLGTTIGSIEAMDLSPYLEVTLGDQTLSSNQYEVTFVNRSLSTVAVGSPQQRPRIRVSHAAGNVSPVELDLPIVVEWGDSVVFGGANELNERTVAAFTLHHGTQPRISSAYGSGGATQIDYIRPGFFGEYYSFSRFSMFGHSSRNLSTSSADNAVQARGSDFRNRVLTVWTNPLVNYGDVVHTWVAEADKNVLRVNDQFVNHGGEVYYEVTPSGYRPLNINRAVTTEHEIEMHTSEAELRNRVAEFIDISNLPNMRVVGFADLPDVSRPGKSQGIIRVAETLASGRDVMYEYTVDFDVTSNVSLIDVNLPKELVFGSTDLYEGKVVSPVYSIENNSAREVRVNIQKVDVTVNDNQLALLGSSDSDPTETSSAVRLVMEAGATSVDLNENTSNQLLANLSSSQSAQFTIGGQYFGEYGEAIRLGLDIHYRFEILP